MNETQVPIQTLNAPLTLCCQWPRQPSLTDRNTVSHGILAILFSIFKSWYQRHSTFRSPILPEHSRPVHHVLMRWLTLVTFSFCFSRAKVLTDETCQLWSILPLQTQMKLPCRVRIYVSQRNWMKHAISSRIKPSRAGSHHTLRLSCFFSQWPETGLAWLPGNHYKCSITIDSTWKVMPTYRVDDFPFFTKGLF